LKLLPSGFKLIRRREGRDREEPRKKRGKEERKGSD
jgi:hypothetical protein